MTKQALEPLTSEPQEAQGAAHVSHRPTEHFPLWLTPRLGMEYVGCPTVHAFYMWRQRHGIIARSNNTVSRLDLDRALNPRNRKRAHLNTLANLRKRAV